MAPKPEYKMTLVEWDAVHSKHGLSMTAPSLQKGWHYHVCPCGSRLPTLTPEALAAHRK